jgi:hypothetical protein
MLKVVSEIFSYVDPDSKEKQIEKIIISIKGGHVNVSHVRDLVGVVKRENAAIGYFVTLEKATRPMSEEAIKAGFYEYPFTGNRYRKIQILTVEEIMDGKRFDSPGEKISHTSRAIEAKQIQKKLFE